MVANELFYPKVKGCKSEYWVDVSVVTEEWRWRMKVRKKGFIQEGSSDGFCRPIQLSTWMQHQSASVAVQNLEFHSVSTDTTTYFNQIQSKYFPVAMDLNCLTKTWYPTGFKLEPVGPPEVQSNY